MSTSEVRKIREEYLKRIGYCVVCGGKPAAKGRMRCLDCLDKFGVWRERLREKHIAAGQCIWCGQPKEADRKNRRICAACQSKASERWNTEKQRRIAEGRCSRCGRALPHDSAYRMCVACREKHRINYHMRRDKKPGTGKSCREC